MERRVDVVVVGAGPVGLLTAIELTLAGAGVLVLERLPAPSTAIKALGIGPLGSEALMRRGMAQAIAAAEARTTAAIGRFTTQTGAALRGPASRFAGHFAGLSLIRRDAQREPDRQARLVDQQGVEALLADRAREMGIVVRRGHDVVGLTQRADGVELEWTSPAGGGHVGCSHLVGCDGGRSPVRKMAGFAFPGTAPTATFYQAIATVDHPDRLLPVGWHRTAGGVFSYGPIPGRLFMLDFSGPPVDRQAPVTRGEIEAVLRRVSGAEVRVTALEQAGRWADNTRLADTYRCGRVLLAGDAAHVHSPFGGQGLSLGLVDAANLGWKLAAVVRGAMPDALLDSYTAERRPVAEAVLANTLAQVAIMRPDPQAGAMRDLMASLMGLDDVNRLVGEMMTGLSTRYALGTGPDPGPDPGLDPGLDIIGRLIGDRPVGRHGTGPALYDLMQDGMGVLIDASTGGRAARLVADGAWRIRCVATDAGPSMLIRPDACVAWADDTDGIAGLEDALHGWFGAPPAPSPDCGRDTWSGRTA